MQKKPDQLTKAKHMAAKKNSGTETANANPETTPSGKKNYALTIAGAGTNLLSLFKGTMKKRGLAPIVKPKDMEAGDAVAGKILRIIESPKKEFKSRIIIIDRMDPETGKLTGTELGFPMTKVIENCMGETVEEQNKHVDRMILIQKTGMAAKSTGKGRKPAHLFDVYIEDVK